MSQTARRSRKPPSRIRYEESHPVVSARLSKDDHEKLKVLLASRKESFPRFLRDAIGSAKAKYDRDYRLGYDKGKEDWQTWYHCAVCDKRIDIIPKGESHEALIRYMREEGWQHSSCHKEEPDRRVYARSHYKQPRAI
jgi:hypothetical protein